MIQQRDARSLAEGYSPVFRFVEASSLIVFLLLVLHLAYSIVKNGNDHVFVIAAAFIAGLLASDLVSGIVHWAADTWGTPDWPFVGKTLIRPFREHHVDPMAMTQHDLIESSGANCLVSLPVLIAIEFVNLNKAQVFSLFFVTAMTAMVFFVFVTSFTHKWAHTEKNPKWVSWLQKYHLILTVEHHAWHHQPPFNKNYCITTGWLNASLVRIRFFSRAERLITKLTGALPRKDDIGELAAKSIFVTDANLQDRVDSLPL